MKQSIELRCWWMVGRFMDGKERTYLFKEFKVKQSRDHIIAALISEYKEFCDEDGIRTSSIKPHILIEQRGWRVEREPETQTTRPATPRPKLLKGKTPYIVREDEGKLSENSFVVENWTNLPERV